MKEKILSLYKEHEAFTNGVAVGLGAGLFAVSVVLYQKNAAEIVAARPFTLADGTTGTEILRKDGLVVSLTKDPK